jgi:hypothetical protein
MGKSDELAMARMAAAASQQTVGEKAEARRLQAGIDQTMAATIADAVSGRMYSPWRGNSAGTVVPAGAVRVVDAPSGPRGFVEPQPLGPPPGVKIIDAIVERALPNPATQPKVSTDELIAQTERVLADLKAKQAAEKKAGLEKEKE